MAYTGEQLEANAQLERAKVSLGEALGQTQDIGHSGLDIDHISATLAKSVQNIFSIQRSGLAAPESPSNIQSAMNNLRETLMMLQEVQSNDSGLDRITSTTARILALLYPVSKVLEKIGEPIPLTEKQHSAEPIPLTSAQPSQAPIPLSRQPSRAPTPSVPAEDDRRSYERRMIEVDIGIHSSTNFFTGFSQDISSGGLFVSTYDILDIGTALNVNFRLPDGPVLSLSGKVRWVREYNDITPEMEPGMGVQFESLTPDDRQAINLFISQNPPIFYDDE